MDDQLRQFRMIQEGMRLSNRPNSGGFVDLTLRLGLPNYSDQNHLTQNIVQYQSATHFNCFDDSHDSNCNDYQVHKYNNSLIFI